MEEKKNKNIKTETTLQLCIKDQRILCTQIFSTKECFLLQI